MRPHLHNQAHHDRYQHSEKPGHTSDGWWMTTKILHQDDHGLQKQILVLVSRLCWVAARATLTEVQEAARANWSPPSPPYSPLYLPAGGCLTSAQLEFIIFFVQLLFVAISTLLYSVIWMVDQKVSRISRMAAFHLTKDLIANVMDIGQQSESLKKVAADQKQKFHAFGVSFT